MPLKGITLTESHTQETVVKMQFLHFTIFWTGPVVWMAPPEDKFKFCAFICQRPLTILMF